MCVCVCVFVCPLFLCLVCLADGSFPFFFFDFVHQILNESYNKYDPIDMPDHNSTGADTVKQINLKNQNVEKDQHLKTIFYSDVIGLTNYLSVAILKCTKRACYYIATALHGVVIATID